MESGWTLFLDVNFTGSAKSKLPTKFVCDTLSHTFSAALEVERRDAKDNTLTR